MKKNHQYQNRPVEAGPKKSLSKGRIALLVLFSVLFLGSIVGIIVSFTLMTPDNPGIMVVMPICGFLMTISFVGFFITLIPFIQKKMMKISVPYAKEYMKETGISDMMGNSKEIVCPHCGGTNKGEAKFCNSCGKALTKTCPKCHVSNPSDARFCNSCGERLD